jgi:hypothetical protein
MPEGSGSPLTYLPRKSVQHNWQSLAPLNSPILLSLARFILHNE